MTDLKKIPGVGSATKEDLIKLGYTNVESLKNQNPEEMYKRLCDINGYKVDRCVLYVYKCAVYYANNKKHDPELLKWWNWKDI